jgi:tetratricopeptide (TPR) repeat protein
MEIKIQYLKTFAVVMLVLAVTSASAGTLDDRCRALIASGHDDAGAAGSNSAYYRDAEAGYRQCRDSRLPVLVRAQAAAKYATAERARGNPQTSIAAYREAAALLSTADTEQREMLISILENAAAVEASIQLRGAAIADAERAFGLRVTSYGNDSAEAAIGLMKLGLIYGDLGDFRASEQILRVSLKMAKAACGECTAVSEIYSAFWAIYTAQGDDAQAKRYDELALKVLSMQ